MAISEIESNLLNNPNQGEMPPQDPAEALTKYSEVLFDKKGHKALYGRFIGEEGQIALALLEASHRDGMPIIEAQALAGSRDLESIEFRSVIELDDLATVDPKVMSLEPLYRELAGEIGVNWVNAKRVICVPMRADTGSDFRLRAVPAINPTPETLPTPASLNPEDAMTLRLILGSFADRHKQ